MQYRYVLLAYAGSPEEEPLFPIAAVCVPLDPIAQGGSLFIKDDWERKVKDSHRGYIQDTFDDWLQLMKIDAGVIPPQIVDLSVGPLRTVAYGDCEGPETITRVEDFLTKSYRRLSSPS